MAPSPTRPLHVVLHHAGGSAKQAINEAFAAKHRHQYVAKEHCGLYLDCRSLKTDWWWGWKTIEKDKELHKKQLQSAEERVLQSIEWAVKNQKLDRNRIYLSGRSMGGSGSLGIGYVRGDLFAAILVNVPAGAEHFLFRLQNSDYPDPPPTINTSSQTDGWSKRQEDLLAYCEENKLPMIFGWGPFGHASRPSMVNSAVYDFPWREIVKNDAYPVFGNTDSDQIYPGFKGKGKDQVGQINGYFRWKNQGGCQGALFDRVASGASGRSRQAGCHSQASNRPTSHSVACKISRPRRARPTLGK